MKKIIIIIAILIVIICLVKFWPEIKPIIYWILAGLFVITLIISAIVIKNKNKEDDHTIFIAKQIKKYEKHKDEYFK